MIDIQNLTCQFDTNIILDAINVNITDHLSILGANGSGKSTLAKAIASLIPYEGTITIHGQNTSNIAPTQKAKMISYIPTKLEIHDFNITVEEFILLGRYPHKKSFFDYSQEDRAIVDETLDFLKITHLKEHTVYSLSSGEQSLILIAQALVQQSEIIIFDEPTANLDPHNSKIIAQHIKNLKHHHQTILITHDVHLAAFMQNPVLFIKETQVHFYQDNFFDDTNLENLYNVKFINLVAQYD